MTTQLADRRTKFLPFNRGDDGGAGQPDQTRAATRPPTCGSRSGSATPGSTSLAASSTAARRGHRERQDAHGRSSIFPRYHQWDAVLKLEDDARQSGAGKSYLVEHSAGSGKSNTIAWLAHRLSTLARRQRREGLRPGDHHHRPHRPRPTAPGHRRPVRDEEGRRRADRAGSKQLADALVNGTAPIIVSTLQKFPFAKALEVIIEKAAELKDRSFAVIVDEAQARRPARRRRAEGVLGGGAVVERESTDEEENGEEEADAEDVVGGHARRARPAEEPQLLRVHGDAEGQDARAVRRRSSPTASHPAVPPLLDAPGDRGGLHPRRPRELHDLQDLLEGREGDEDDPEVVERRGRVRDRALRRSPPARTSRRRSRSSSSTSGRSRAKKIGGQAKAMVVTQLAPLGRPLQARDRQVHRRRRATHSRRSSPSPAPSTTRRTASSSRSRR